MKAQRQLQSPTNGEAILTQVTGNGAKLSKYFGVEAKNAKIVANAAPRLVVRKQKVSRY